MPWETWSALRGWVWPRLDDADREGAGLFKAAGAGGIDVDEAAADGQGVPVPDYDRAGGAEDLEGVQARLVAGRPDHRDSDSRAGQPDAVMPAWAWAAGECPARSRQPGRRCDAGPWRRAGRKVDDWPVCHWLPASWG